MRVIIGLGNPGPKYRATRHNVGFRVLDRLASRYGAAWREDAALDSIVAAVEIGGVACLLVQPQTFMNRSGSAVRAVLERWTDLDPSTDLLVVYDDMDLPCGQIRLRPTGGGGGHNGIGDILRELETKAVPRLRFGIGHPGSSGPVIDWVLAPFSSEEEAEISGCVERAAEAAELTVREGIKQAMGQFNRRG